MTKKVFITGGTGYIGQRLIDRLLKEGFELHALVRKGSEEKLPVACNKIIGNALDANSFRDAIPNGCIFIHLVGVSHPSPSMKQHFIDIDLASINASVAAAKDKSIEQFIYLSVAQPNEIMKDYTEVRMQGEKLIRENFKSATFIRPFYVLGPGHRWPLLLTPIFKILSLTKSGKEKANRLGLVWIGQMVNALTDAVNHPSPGIRIVKVSDIKKFSKKYQ